MRAILEKFADDEVTAKRRDELIEGMARTVVNKRLEIPAIFLLEAHKPLSFLASQGMLLTAPLLGAFFGFKNVNDFARVIEDRNNIDRLVECIERLSGARERKVPPAGADQKGNECDT